MDEEPEENSIKLTTDTKWKSAYELTPLRRHALDTIISPPWKVLYCQVQPKYLQ